MKGKEETQQFMGGFGDDGEETEAFRRTWLYHIYFQFGGDLPVSLFLYSDFAWKRASVLRMRLQLANGFTGKPARL